MKFKLALLSIIVLAAACSSGETADTVPPTTTMRGVEEVAVTTPEATTTTTTTLDQRICENDGSTDWREICAERQEPTYTGEELEEGLRNISSDGSDEIVAYVSSGDVCADYFQPAPHRDAGQPTDLDKDGVPHGTKVRTDYLTHSQPDDLMELEGSQFVYAPWKEYEGRKVWESYPVDLELYNFYFGDIIVRTFDAETQKFRIGELAAEGEDFLARKAEYQGLGCLWHETVKEIWDTADIYTPEAQARIDAGETVYRYNQAGDGIETIIDPASGFQVVIQFDKNELPRGEYYNVCPPHPRSPEAKEELRYDLRGVDAGLVSSAQSMASRIPPDDSLEMEWFLSGITTPEGRQIYHESDYGYFSRLRALLSLSPGEPSDTSVHSLAADYYPSLILDGYFPGDWSSQSMEVLNRHLAATTAHKINSFYSVLSSEASIFEKCVDLESTSGYAVDRKVSEIGTLEQNLSKGLNTIASGTPASEVYVAYHAGQLSLSIVCNPAHTLHFKDSFTGDKVPTKTRAELPAGVVAHVYAASNQGQFAFLGLVSERAGNCRNADGSLTQAFNDVLSDVQQYLGSINSPAWEQVPAHEWYNITQAESWESHRDPSYINRLLCEAGIPYGEIIDNRLTRPIQLPCTDEQWEHMEELALNARGRTNFLVGQDIGTPRSDLRITASELSEWYERNHNTWLGQWFTEHVPTEEYIGCGNRLGNHIKHPYASDGQNEHSKKPWTFGLLPGTSVEDEWGSQPWTFGFLPGTSVEDEWGYPIPYTPCEGWEPPPFGDDTYWWPLP